MLLVLAQIDKCGRQAILQLDLRPIADGVGWSSRNCGTREPRRDGSELSFPGVVENPLPSLLTVDRRGHIRNN